MAKVLTTATGKVVKNGEDKVIVVSTPAPKTTARRRTTSTAK